MIPDGGVYIGGLFFLYYMILVGAITGYRGAFLAVLVIIFLGSIAIFRGAVGTDTAMYEAIIGLSRSAGYDWGGREIGFVLLAEVLCFFIESDAAVIRVVAVFFVAGLLFFVARADDDERFLVLAYFIPAQFFDYSMNIIRIGLATIFFLLGMQLIRRGSMRGGLGVMLSGLFFHYSMIISVCYLFVTVGMVSFRRFFLPILLILIVSSAMVFFLREYLLARFAAYSGYSPPGDFSGLSDLIVLLVFMVGALFASLDMRVRFAFVVTTSIFVVGAFLLSRYTVAGMRILDLLVVAAPVSLLVLHARTSRALNWRVKSFLLLAGVLGGGAALRNFLASSGQGRSPWIPYELIF